MLYHDILDIKFSCMLSKLRDFESMGTQSSTKIAFLRNITIEPLLPFIRYQCMTNGIKTDAYICDFDNIMQDILDANSGLYAHNPKIIFIFIKLDHIASKLYLQFPKLNSSEISVQIENVLKYYKDMLDALRSRTNALIILNTFEVNPFPSGGISDSQKLEGETNIIRTLNRKLLKLTNKYIGISIIDFDLICSRIGFVNFQNNMQWHMSKMPFSNLALKHIATEAAKFIIASEGNIKKCIIVDCDNTLWGGVVGEDGDNGILLDQTHPGSYFLQFQKDLLNLKSHGILLAICSKNNEADVLSVFINNENMILKDKDFSCMKINWDLKVNNIKQISKELNIGLQHIIFVDDSDFEVEMVRELIPEVSCILVPKNLSQLKYIFDGKGYFDKLQVSNEDSNRTEMYLAENLRSKELASFTSINDYYKNLKIVAKARKLNDSDITRVAQLTQKTNQFNLTTIRYSEQEIKMLMQSNESQVITLKAEDKFGAYGLIGVAILRFKDNYCEIDTLLMSCRAIGRGLEEILFNECIKQIKVKVVDVVYGRFSKTKKNIQVKNFFEDHGFSIKKRDTTQKLYYCDINNINISLPAHIKKI
jgi:FkbH-like protein